MLQVVLIVNVATYCSFTEHYLGLNELQTKFNNDLVVLGFPCNQFLLVYILIFSYYKYSIYSDIECIILLILYCWCLDLLTYATSIFYIVPPPLIIFPKDTKSITADLICHVYDWEGYGEKFINICYLIVKVLFNKKYYELH